MTVHNKCYDKHVLHEEEKKQNPRKILFDMFLERIYHNKCTAKQSIPSRLMLLCVVMHYLAIHSYDIEKTTFY